jgi:two-component system, NtrC family, nitrogen regulation response regulator NtrX
MATVLVIDDQQSVRKSFREVLEYESFTVLEAEDGQKGLDALAANSVDVVLCDIKMPKMDGMEFLDLALAGGFEMPIIMISGHGNIETAVDSIKKGAYDFIQKPIDLPRLLVTLRNAVEKKTLVTETKQLKKKVSKSKAKEIIGESESIRKIRDLIQKVAATDARILVTGSNGTGKELVAHWVHALSARAEGPMVEVNCAAIPTELIESELFGHEKGAFTSAVKQRQGKFELAHGGTLFLDEIGDMSLSAQAKVLRALQENKIARVGGDKEISVDVRVVAATNKDLAEEIRRGNFREDLFHRLNVIPIHVPDLNDRRSDIPLLAEHFLQLILEEQNMGPKKIRPDAMNALQELDWTGNIRELRNVVERLIILSDQEITATDVEVFAKPNKK